MGNKSRRKMTGRTRAGRMQRIEERREAQRIKRLKKRAQQSSKTMSELGLPQPRRRGLPQSPLLTPEAVLLDSFERALHPPQVTFRLNKRKESKKSESDSKI